MLSTSLRAEIDLLWDKFWAGGMANPLTAIDQINYLVFLRRLEDMDNARARRARTVGEKFQSVFEVDATGKDCRWSHWRNLPAEQMLEHVQTVVFPWMKQLDPASETFTQYLRDAAFLIPKASLLVEAVSVIDSLAITDRNVDTQGDIYEYMLSKLSVAGQIGQFRTPRHIIRAMVSLVNPRLGETVVDPACGTGGFLIAARQHVMAGRTSEHFLQADEFGMVAGALGDLMTSAERKRLKDSQLIGLDFDPVMVRIAAMNMVLHGIERPAVRYADSLGQEFSHSPIADVVLANPPFSGSVEVAELSDGFTIKTKKTELLFVELILNCLKPGGRAALIVPDGVLFGTTRAHRAARRKLLDENSVEAVVSLPAGAFRPYTGSKTSILVVRRGGSTTTVWMYEVLSDGYTLDDKRLPLPHSDLPEAVTGFADKSASLRSFLVERPEIDAADGDLSVGRYRPIELLLPKIEDPAVQLNQALRGVVEIERRLRELEARLG